MQSLLSKGSVGYKSLPTSPPTKQTLGSKSPRRKVICKRYWTRVNIWVELTQSAGDKIRHPLTTPSGTAEVYFRDRFTPVVFVAEGSLVSTHSYQDAGILTLFHIKPT